MSPAILVVDDMTIYREPIESLLREEGYRTQGAANGREAMTLMQANAPDLVLLDLSMPIMDGIAVLERMRSSPSLNRIPVIVLSADGERHRVREAAALGASGYVLKSQFSSKDMLSRVSKQLAAGSTGPHPSSAASRPARSAERAGGSTVPLSGPRRGVAASAQVGTPSMPQDQAEALRSIQPAMTAEAVIRHITRSFELKGLSPAVTQVLQVTARPDCTAEAVAKIISQDPVVALKVLKRANSPIYTRRDAVDSVQKAVVRIGLDKIRQTVLNMSVIDRFSNVSFDGSMSVQQFWEHSVATGIIAAEIVNATSAKGADTAFTMGLLHDVGRAVLIEQLGDHYVPVLATARRLGLPLEQVETRMLSLNHADIMDQLLRAWGFPDHLIRPILLHHLSVGGIRSAASSQATEAMTLALANRLAHALLLGSSGNDAIYPTEELCAEIGVNGNIVNHLEIVAGQRTDEMKFSILTQSSTTPWPRHVESVRAELSLPFCPLYISHRLGIDAIRIFCNTLADPLVQGRAPNVAVVHCPLVTDQASLIVKLKAAERNAGVERLPLIFLSRPGQIQVDRSLSSERACRAVATPFAINRFVSVVNELLTSS